MMIKIKLYARLIIEGAITLDEVPNDIRMAVETEVEKIRSNI